MTAPQTQDALYPSRSAAGAFLGRQLYRRCPPPVVVLGVSPTGVEVAASAAKAMSCPFDVIVGAHVRLEGLGAVGAIAEDSDAILDPDFQPRFGALEALNAAIDRPRRAIKTERLLFRGQRPIWAVGDLNVVIVDAQLTSSWKVLAAAEAVAADRPRRVWIAAPVSPQAVQERVRARRYEFVSRPSVILDASGHARAFGDPQDPSAERLRSIVVARQAA